MAESLSEPDRILHEASNAEHPFHELYLMNELRKSKRAAYDRQIRDFKSEASRILMKKCNSIEPNIFTKLEQLSEEITALVADASATQLDQTTCKSRLDNLPVQSTKDPSGTESPKLLKLPGSGIVTDFYSIIESLRKLYPISRDEQFNELSNQLRNIFQLLENHASYDGDGVLNALQEKVNNICSMRNKFYSIVLTDPKIQ